MQDIQVCALFMSKLFEATLTNLKCSDGAEGSAEYPFMFT
jgi:hypothetical protein